MLFNSIDFAVFLPIVFTIYWLLQRFHFKYQNFFLVAASYVFYGWWDWRFLSLLMFSSLVDFAVGMALKNENNNRKRKLFLSISIAVNLGLLGFFKYYNFFIENFETAFSFLGSGIEIRSLKIILPVGISFYTFQTMSYGIDVYFRKLEPTKNFIAFLAFVSFFPQLVAGPIERATKLLPQFYKKRHFNYNHAVDGMQQILWGLFKKMVIADCCAEYANLIFNNSNQYSGAMLLFGVVLFSFQIYGDFSGYSDIAIGTARLFGFGLMKNFNFPYFSRDIAEFWRRWHISLSTWFRDYLYIPLGGSKGSLGMKVRNTIIVFAVSGFWHGAKWTFVVWGLLNAIYFIPLLLAHRNRTNLDTVAQGKVIPSLKEIFQVLFTFSLTVFAWIFFRARNLTHAFQFINDMLGGLFNKQSWVETYNYIYWKFTLPLFFIIVFFIMVEWFGREGEYAISKILLKSKRSIRWLVYVIIIFFILWFGGNEQEFIYFQF